MSFHVTVISNAGPLIALGKLNCLELLEALYMTVQMPEAVYAEVVQEGIARGEPDAQLVENFWRTRKWPVVSLTPLQMRSLTSEVKLGPGESEVLALATAMAQQYPLVLIDDEVARAEARRLGIHALGTLGILVQSFRQQHITLEEAEQYIEQLIQRPDIWISERLCRQTLEGLRREAEVNRL